MKYKGFFPCYHLHMLLALCKYIQSPCSWQKLSLKTKSSWLSLYSRNRHLWHFCMPCDIFTNNMNSNFISWDYKYKGNDSHIPTCKFDNKAIYSIICWPSCSTYRCSIVKMLRDTHQDFANIGKVYFAFMEWLAHGSMPRGPPIPNTSKICTPTLVHTSLVVSLTWVDLWALGHSNSYIIFGERELTHTSVPLTSIQNKSSK